MGNAPGSPAAPVDAVGVPRVPCEVPRLAKRRAVKPGWEVLVVPRWSRAPRERQLEAALEDLVRTLPRCDACEGPATRAFVRGESRYCDAHGEPLGAPEYPRARALRWALALLSSRKKEP